MRGMLLKCPSCGKQMQRLLYEGIEIQKCDPKVNKPCKGGIWITSKQLIEIVKRRVETFDRDLAIETARQSSSEECSPNRSRVLSCPNHACKVKPCLTKLVFAHDSGIHIDRCGSCEGIWLDPGEIETIQRYVEGIEHLINMGQD
jgi:Zn-finger nucleic acid-binding protein